MDKEQARFILKCFRPDGADAADRDFAEALAVAAADRDLGEWLAKERASDAGFSKALSDLELPDGLRAEIMAGLAAERGDEPAIDELDASLIGALSMVGAPSGLRGEILTAMSQSKEELADNEPTASIGSRSTNPQPKSKKGSGWWRFGVPLAAAAGIALAVVVNRGDSSGDPSLAGDGSNPANILPVSVSKVESGAITALESPTFKLDMKHPDKQELFTYIHKAGLKCPNGAVPKGLKEVPGIGCLTIEIDGKPGAIVCFECGEDEVVHLVVFSRSDVEGELPDRENANIKLVGEWSVAEWQEDERVFMMLSKTDNKRRLSELF